ncbi:YwaF family protein [Oceanobacillus halotolerans]|uniref:YwaF family protein n=1 Tax=Oceanobacillus halotolerans TaxID=2663380 RepID=UPI0013D131AA|nr:TIGR02206 family membrane protein [Oceanobacillus halotolerans]
MNQFWSEDVGFISPFDLQHLFYIAIVVALLLLLHTNRDNVRKNGRRIGIGILIVSLSQQIMLYSWYGLETGFDIGESLPLHISRVTSLLGIYFLLTRNEKVLDIIFYFSLFAYGSFLYPQRVYPITHIIGISFLVNHAITILLPYYGYIAYRWRPNRKGFVRAYTIFLTYFFFVYFLNPLIDGNYFYLKYRPFFSEWPDYLYVPSVLIVTLVGFYAAYRVVTRKEKKYEALLDQYKKCSS